MICSDKTGTLTQNRMTLTKVWVEGEPALEAVSSQNSQAARKLLQYGALCCDGSVTFGEDGSEQHIGDPTETAILVAAHKNGMEQGDLEKASPPAGGIALRFRPEADDHGQPHRRAAGGHCKGRL